MAVSPHEHGRSLHGLQPSQATPIRVLVVDDSGVMRRAMRRILESDPDFEVVATAKNGVEAIELAGTLVPDAITMDVKMPRLDGLKATETIMGRHPVPIVIVSAYARPGGTVAARALASGAVHIVEKPAQNGIALDLDGQAAEIRRKVRSAARVPVVRNASFVTTPAKRAANRYRFLAPRREGVRVANPAPRATIVAIGASTGGTVALAEILPSLPADFPASLVIVQHMPPGYTAELAKSLDQVAAITVAEARHGDCISPGKAFIAPGGHHMEVHAGRIRLRGGPAVKHHRPSVDVLFDSLVSCGSRVRAFLLSGMGDDGVAGMARLRAAGAATVVQNEASCVVWGMAGAAVRMGCATQCMPPALLARYLVDETAERAPIRASSDGKRCDASLSSGRGFGLAVH